jgi:hypothetical protein
MPGGGLEDPGQRFDGRGFSRAVGSDLADDLSWLDGKGNIVHRLDDSEVGGKQIFHRAVQALAVIEDFKIFCQACIFD